MLRLVDSAGASCVREDSASFESTAEERLPSLTKSQLLEARFGDRDRSAQASGLQRGLRRLAAGQAQVEIAIGAGLEALHSRFDIRELGHSNFDALCTGRLGFSAAHGRELRRLSRRLPELPHLREAFLAGLIPRTRVRELLDIATPEDDAAWARLAMQLTTRELKRRVGDVRAGRDPAPEGACASDDEENDELVRVSWQATAAERATWEFGLALLRQLIGKRGPLSELAEALAAETLSGFGPFESPEEPAPGPAELHVRSRPPNGRRRRPNRREPKMRRALRRLQRALDRARDEDEAALAIPDIEGCETAWQVSDHLVALVRRLTGLESERARLLSWMQGRALYRELGHVRFHDWLEHELGLAPRDARRLLDLQSRLSLLPSLEQAWHCGELTTHQAWQLSEVAAFDTQDDWMRYALSATPKLLDAAVEQLRIAERRAPRPGPPWGVPLRTLLLDWQEHFGLRRRRELRVAEGACASSGADRDPGEPAGLPLSGSWRLGRIGFSAPASVAGLWRQACAAVRTDAGEGTDAGTVLSDSDVVRRMLEHLLEVHVTEEVLAQARRHRAIERDGWTCQMPHCRSNGPFHEHHRQFRSAGGSDDLANLTALCVGCHAMLHAGHVVVLGEAPDGLTFLLGTRREAYADERRRAHVGGRREAERTA